MISGAIPAKFRGISRNFTGIAQKSLQKSKNSAEFRVGRIPWTPYSQTNSQAITKIISLRHQLMVAGGEKECGGEIYLYF